MLAGRPISRRSPYIRRLPTVAAAITGTASLTTDPVTLSASGSLKIQGTMALFLDPVTLSASGLHGVITGTASLTTDPVTFTATGKLPITGTAALTTASVVLSAAGSLAITGTATLTTGDVILTATGINPDLIPPVDEPVVTPGRNYLTVATATAPGSLTPVRVRTSRILTPTR
jgi:hypothetical protein